MPRSLRGADLAAGRKLRHGRQRRRLGRLAARVRVDLGVQHQHVYVAPARQHMVQTAVADVIGPAVAAENPNTLLHQLVGQAVQVLGRRIIVAFQRCLQLRHVGALCFDAGFVRLIRVRATCWQVHRRSRRAVDSPVRSHTPTACRASGACPDRTRRCPRRASCSMSDRGRHRFTVYGVVGRLPP